MELKPEKFDRSKLNHPSNNKIDRFGQGYKSDEDESKWSGDTPQETRRAHARADVDTGPRSIHHTLGIGRNQASPGNHIHDGITSKKLGPYEMDPVNLGKTRPAWTLPTRPSVSDIVNFLRNFVDFRSGGATIVPEVQSGAVNVNLDNVASFSQPITFPVAYPPGSVPRIMVNINSRVSALDRWDARATNITNTGFQIFLFRGVATDATATATGVNLQWIATV